MYVIVLIVCITINADGKCYHYFMAFENVVEIFGCCLISWQFNNL